MKNFIQPGDYGVSVVTPNAVVSGQLVVIGSMFGIAACDAPAGGTVALAMEGVYTLPKIPGDVYTAGQVAKADTNGNVNAAGTVGAIGWIVAAAPSGSTTCSVRLVPSVASPALAAASHEHTPKHAHEAELAGAKKH